jgi:hypothetical protein
LTAPFLRRRPAVAILSYIPKRRQAVACDDGGIPSFDLLRRRQRDDYVFLYALDLIELTGKDRRRDAPAHRMVDLSRLLADAGAGMLANEWVDGGDFDGATVFARMLAGP